MLTRPLRELLKHLARREAVLELYAPGTLAHENIAHEIRNLAVFLGDPRPYRLYTSPTSLISYFY